MNALQLSLWIGCLLGGTLAAAGATDEATARRLPWSGYWWPIAKGELLGPLGKYDQLSGARSYLWERQFHPPGPQVPGWHGYCHAWAASAVLEYEPRSPRWVQGRTAGQPTLLGVGDQKGLLAASHALDIANTYGDRFGDGAGSEDPNDIAPDVLWQVLRMHIKQQGVPIVLDLEAGPEVWNYPVYAYRIQYQPSSQPNVQLGQLSLWAVDDAVPPDHVGMMIHYQTYQFTLRIQNGAVVMGSGRWIGPSVVNHPDFAWYPYVVKAENPQINYQAVKRLVASSESGSQPAPGNTASQPSVGSTGTVAPHPSPIGPPVGSVQPGLPLGQGVPLSPLELVAAIAERTSSFGLDITVDRFDGGRYAVGARCSVLGTSERSGYLYLFSIDSAGELSLIYPGPRDDNRIPGQTRFVLPPPESGAFVLQGPLGMHRIKAVVCDRPLILTGLTWSGEGQRRDVAAGSPQGQFRWYPSVRGQVRMLLSQYQKNQRLSKELVDGMDVRTRLAQFAQDEVTFYVGPREGPGP